MKTIKIIIKGKVQGVFFRNFTKTIAQKLEIKGWVQNKRNGSVEINAQGTNSQLEELVHKCYEGSPESIVESLQKDFIETNEVFEEFVIKY